MDWECLCLCILAGQVLSSDHSDQKSEKLVFSFHGQLSLPVNAVSAVDSDSWLYGSWNFAQKKYQSWVIDPRHLTRDAQLLNWPKCLSKRWISSYLLAIPMFKGKVHKKCMKQILYHLYQRIDVHSRESSVQRCPPSIELLRCDIYLCQVHKKVLCYPCHRIDIYSSKGLWGGRGMPGDAQWVAEHLLCSLSTSKVGVMQVRSS